MSHIEEIRVLEEIDEEKKKFGGGIAYTLAYSSKKRDLEEYLEYIDFGRGRIDEAITWRVDAGGDLYNCLKAKIYKEKAYPSVIPFMIGTLWRACIGYFLSDKGVFQVNSVSPPSGLELISGSGTVGIEEEKLMPHIHVVVADHAGNAYGGHLFPGTRVKEYIEGFLIKLGGVRLERIWNDKIRAFPLRFFEEE